MLRLTDLKEDDKIIVSKSLAFSISSPIDTFRQNALIEKPVTMRKTCIGMGTGLLVSSLISIPCHKTISYLEQYNMNQLLSVAAGVIIANVVKIPIIYNYKKIQTGIKLTKSIPMSSLKNVMKISLIEDVIEETVKYTISKNKIASSEKISSNTNTSMSTTEKIPSTVKSANSTSSWKRTLLESALLFSLSYPFDILKNRGLYGIANLSGSKIDFASKVAHKNLQNVLFLQLLTK